jgi:hypothetical protein
LCRQAKRGKEEYSGDQPCGGVCFCLHDVILVGEVIRLDADFNLKVVMLV